MSHLIRSTFVLAASLLITMLCLANSGASAQTYPSPTPTPATAYNQNTVDGLEPFLLQEEAQGGDCTLIVPANPLSAQGLATPYVLDNDPNSNGGCTMTNAVNLGAFVQATILDPATGQLSEYDPLVISNGKSPAIPPVVPALPSDAIVTIDTGFNGNILFLAGPGASQFDTGLPNSPFGQVAFDNGPAFFAAAEYDVAQGKTVIPPLGNAFDGLLCPTVHDFSLVDQDPSDNVTTSYLVTQSGQTAADNPTNENLLPNATPVNNGSDNLLLDKFVDPAIGCQGSELYVPSLSSPGTTEATQGTDELLADSDQQPPVALVEPNDPMVTVGADDDIIAGDYPTAGNLSIVKTNLYREGIGQPLLEGNPVTYADYYCQQMTDAATRVQNDEQFETGFGSPNGDPLPEFMANRFNTSETLQNCTLFGNDFTQIPVPDVTATPTPTQPATMTTPYNEGPAYTGQPEPITGNGYRPPRNHRFNS